jgi:hypothetical protein
MDDPANVTPLRRTRRPSRFAQPAYPDRRLAAGNGLATVRVRASVLAQNANARILAPSLAVGLTSVTRTQASGAAKFGRRAADPIRRHGVMNHQTRRAG